MNDVILTMALFHATISVAFRGSIAQALANHPVLMMPRVPRIDGEEDAGFPDIQVLPDSEGIRARDIRFENIIRK